MERLPARADFTLEFWLKTSGGGYGGWVSTEGELPRNRFILFDEFEEEQKKSMAVLMADIPMFEEASQPGMVITLSQPRNYASVYFMTEGQKEPIIFWKLRKLQDDRWHHLVITAERKDCITVYIDGIREREASIAEWEHHDLPDTPVNLGSDINGNYKVSSGTRFGMRMYPEAWKMEIVREHYFCGAIEKLKEEILERDLGQYPFYDRKSAKLLEEKAKNSELRLLQESAEAVYQELRSDYEAFLLNMKTEPDWKCMIVSDVHCEGKGGKKTETFRSALRWAKELGIDAVLDGGDYSKLGQPFELDSYWEVVQEEWNQRPLFLTVGNHETFELSSDELRKYHCGHLAEQGMVPDGYEHFYYDGVINGCPVIVLSQYSETYTVSGRGYLWAQAGEIKKEQLSFLKERLDRYCGKEKPVFVIFHNAPKSFTDKVTHGYINENMNFIDGDALYSLLEGREDVVLCFGHIHRGFGAGAEMTKMEEGYYALSIPGFYCTAFGYGRGGEEEQGRNHIGYFAWIYGKTIVLRAVDFASREWLTAYDQVVTI